MRKTKFGRMQAILMGHPLSGDLDIMHFEKAGTPDSHDVTEIALSVTGTGVVWCDGVAVPVGPGDAIVIPPGVTHHMEPDPGQVLAMVITFRDYQ